MPIVKNQTLQGFITEETGYQQLRRYKGSQFKHLFSLP
jgi:hypothetical protein